MSALARRYAWAAGRCIDGPVLAIGAGADMLALLGPEACAIEAESFAASPDEAAGAGAVVWLEGVRGPLVGEIAGVLALIAGSERTVIVAIAPGGDTGLSEEDARALHTRLGGVIVRECAVAATLFGADPVTAPAVQVDGIESESVRDVLLVCANVDPAPALVGSVVDEDPSVELERERKARDQLLAINNALRRTAGPQHMAATASVIVERLSRDLAAERDAALAAAAIAEAEVARLRERYEG